MSAHLLDGAALAKQIQAELSERVAKLVANGIHPGLGTILVGNDPPSASYVARKHKACEEVGIASFHEHLGENASEAELHSIIELFNSHPGVDAYLVQLPLPNGLDEEKALLAIDPAKDADGLHPVNLGRLVMGAEGPIACTPAGIHQLLIRNGVQIEGRHVVIIGRGLTIGRPLALLLALKRPNANAAVTVVHTGVENLSDYVRQGDIVISAAGTPGLITADMVKPGAAIVGAGITWDAKRLLSDLDDSVAEVAGWVTPRIGGVGPMTIAMLLSNAVAAAERRAARS